MSESSFSTELIPRQVLFGNPAKTLPRISPDGQKIAYLAPVDNVLNIWVGGPEAQDARVVTRDRDRGIRMFFWAGDNQHILYLQDAGGNENWRLYAVDLESDDIRDLTPFDEVQVRIVERNRRFPNELLIAMNQEDPKFHDVYHLDIKAGKLTQVAKNPGHFAGWLPDADMTIRAAMSATPDGGFELWTRLDGQSDWSSRLKWDSEDSLSSEAVSFSRDGRSLYLKDSRQVNTGRLVKLELGSGNLEVVAEDPHYDVGSVMMHPETYEIQMVAFERERTDWVVMDPSIQGDIDRIQKIHAGDFSIIGRDHADQRWIIAYVQDDGPVKFYVYDRRTQQEKFLFDNKPDLKRYTLAGMEPVTITSRDGLTLHAYITFPPGQERRRMPLVLNVHGGPWTRDTWGYDSEAQWFANRGYVCLQVNYRGSTGYGKDFINASTREWGGRMQDDLTDAVQWAIEEGIADPKRVAIYGGSYGGYAALAGATLTPDLFRCAVDIVGPSNLISMIQSIPPYWAPFLAIEHKRVGHPEKDADFLKSRSPLFHVDQIKIPILIAHGANDPRVKQAESEQIVEAMRKKGIAYEYLLFPDEGHGFAKPENRIKFYAAAEKFLARHLGGRFEPV